MTGDARQRPAEVARALEWGPLCLPRSGKANRDTPQLREDRLDGRVLAVPSFHCRAAFALEVRRVFAAYKPDCVAIELAPALKAPLLEGLAELPAIRVLSYPEANGRRCYMAIDPCDSMVEAARLAVEHDVPLELIDWDVDNYRQKPAEAPDTYALSAIGVPAFYEQMRRTLTPSNPGTKDYNRERHMAAQLRALAGRYRRVLFVFGMAHTERVEKFVISGAADDPAPQITQRAVTVANVTDASFEQILGELPQVTWQYEQWRQSQPRMRTAAPETQTAGLRAAPPEPSANRDAANWDMAAVITAMLADADAQCQRQWGRQANPGVLGQMVRFTRNWAVTSGRLIPDLYKLLVAGKSMVCEDYAGELYLLAMTYPHNPANPQRPTMDLQRQCGSMQGAGGGSVVRFPVRRELPTDGGVPMRLPIRKPANSQERQRHKSDWKRGADWSHCSHIKEDMILEEFAGYVRRRAMEVVAARQTRVQPLVSSLLDGIDLRETIRQWPTKGELYVRESRPARGRVGPVVVIFTDETDGVHDAWRMTWNSEFDYECDLALYSTQPGEQVVGPGISRCEYGGLACLWPAGRVEGDVWSDPALESAANPAERLLMAALGMAVDPYVAYVSERPPSPRARAMASRRGVEVIHLSPGLLAPAAVGRVRTFHVLQGKRVRDYADEYIR